MNTDFRGRTDVRQIPVIGLRTCAVLPCSATNCRSSDFT